MEPFVVSLFIFLAVEGDQLLAREHFVPDTRIRSLRRFADLTFWIAAIVTPFLKTPFHLAVVLIAGVGTFALLGSRSAPAMLLVYGFLERVILKQSEYLKQATIVLFAVFLLAVLMATRREVSGGAATLFSILQDYSIASILAFVAFGINYFFSFSVIVNANMFEASQGIQENLFKE